MVSKKPLILAILDGYGISTDQLNNAIYKAKKPHLDYIIKTHPTCTLKASGTAVGLPAGYIGNSEVGHLTIGAGRIIPQPLSVINNAISTGALPQNSTLIRHFRLLQAHNKPLHIMGLLSDAGVHSHIDHLFAYLDIARKYLHVPIYIHAFLDGRDVPPQSAHHYLEQLTNYTQKLNNITIATLHGRFFAMDRDKNWERTRASYDAITSSSAPHYIRWQESLDAYYNKSITDEFIPPTRLLNVTLNEGDGLLCFNFRADRIRQLVSCFSSSSHAENQHNQPAWLISPYPYGQETHTTPLFRYPHINNTLKEVINAHHKKIYTIAETEKYAHVTYFFNGEKEEQLTHETRVIIPSIKTPTYAHYPCMSAPEITATLINDLKNNAHDFYLVNYANADMVGHSGDMAATIKAIECIDHQIGLLYKTVQELGGSMAITADHGKAEQMWDNALGQPRTAHTNNVVPFIWISPQQNGDPIMLTELADIGPFLLKHMNLPVPPEMKQ